MSKVIEVPGWEYYDMEEPRKSWFPLSFIISYFS